MTFTGDRRVLVSGARCPGCGVRPLWWYLTLAACKLSAQYAATMYNQEAVVALCIEKGATVDMENNNGVTPIMAGARDGFTAIVKMLLEAGADAFQVDEFGRTVRKTHLAATQRFAATQCFAATQRFRSTH